MGKNRKVIGLFQDESGGQTMTEFIRLRAKSYAYSMEDDSNYKKAKGTKNYVTKQRLMVKNYKDCLFNNKIILKQQQKFKIDHNNVYIEQINKIALRSNEDNRLQTFDKVIIHPYGTNSFKVCKSKMLSKI